DGGRATPRGLGCRRRRPRGRETSPEGGVRPRHDCCGLPGGRPAVPLKLWRWTPPRLLRLSRDPADEHEQERDEEERGEPLRCDHEAGPVHRDGNPERRRAAREPCDARYKTRPVPSGDAHPDKKHEFEPDEDGGEEERKDSLVSGEEDGDRRDREGARWAAGDGAVPR